MIKTSDSEKEERVRKLVRVKCWLELWPREREWLEGNFLTTDVNYPEPSSEEDRIKALTKVNNELKELDYRFGLSTWTL